MIYGRWSSHQIEICLIVLVQNSLGNYRMRIDSSLAKPQDSERILECTYRSLDSGVLGAVFWICCHSVEEWRSSELF
jgi:hypothetical protein